MDGRLRLRDVGWLSQLLMDSPEKLLPNDIQETRDRIASACYQPAGRALSGDRSGPSLGAIVQLARVRSATTASKEGSNTSSREQERDREMICRTCICRVEQDKILGPC